MRQSKWTCPRCGAVIPYTSYQIARHERDDLERENEILADKCARLMVLVEKVSDQQAMPDESWRAEMQAIVGTAQ